MLIFPPTKELFEKYRDVFEKQFGAYEEEHKNMLPLDTLEQALPYVKHTNKAIHVIDENSGVIESAYPEKQQQFKDKVEISLWAFTNLQEFKDEHVKQTEAEYAEWMDEDDYYGEFELEWGDRYANGNLPSMMSQSEKDQRHQEISQSNKEDIIDSQFKTTSIKTVPLLCMLTKEGIDKIENATVNSHIGYTVQGGSLIPPKILDKDAGLVMIGSVTTSREFKAKELLERDNPLLSEFRDKKWEDIVAVTIGKEKQKAGNLAFMFNKAYGVKLNKDEFLKASYEDLKCIEDIKPIKEREIAHSEHTKAKEDVFLKSTPTYGRIVPQKPEKQLSPELKAKIDALTPEEQDLLLEKLQERQKNIELSTNEKSRPEVQYVGIFIDHIDGQNLGKDIPKQHVTLAYKPSENEFKEILPRIGETVKLHIDGYGNDGKNEGLAVSIPGNIPYFGAEKKHITLSISQDSSAVKTGFIDFDKPIPDSIKAQLPSNGEISGVVGVFAQDREIYTDKNLFTDMQQSDAKQLFDEQINDAKNESKALAVPNANNKSTDDIAL